MMKLRTALLILLISGLTACGSENYSSTPVVVTAQSGSQVELTGTWQSACYNDGTDYVIDVRVYSVDGRVTVSTQNYTTDTTCASLDSTTTFASDARVSIDDNVAASGWRDGGGGTSTASNSQAGSQFSSTPTVTRYSFPLDDGTTFASIALIDDSTSNWLLYPADTNATDSAGYHDYLASPHPLYKQ